MKPKKKRAKLLPRTKRRPRHKPELTTEVPEVESELDIEPVEPGDIETNDFDYDEGSFDLDS